MVVVCALYKFTRLEDFAALKTPLLATMERLDICGTLLLAREGINGTIAGSRQSVEQLREWLRSDPRLADLETKESVTPARPFKRTRVKLKKEIVTMGVEGLDPDKNCRHLRRTRELECIDCRPGSFGYRYPQ